MKVKAISVLALLLTVVFVNAQDTFTDEELTTYATVMKWAEDEKDALSSVVRDSVGVWIEGTELDAAMYNDLSKAQKDGSIESVEASEGQLAVFNEIQDRIEQKKTAFKETYTSKIKDEIGASLYNSLRKALKTDAELKARYKEIYANLGGGDSEGEDETEDSEG